ncbi:MAG TPA: serine/threonine-protein kinase [Gemmatimonadales bacterium]
MTDTARLTTALADRYRIERELGAGGMATVYLAQDLKHDRHVALKVLRPELAAVLGAERFLAEIKITARLDHPHILTLIDSGAADGFLYYVLPFVRGESLRDKLNREKQLGLEEALQITTQVASALDYAHRQGVIHRDIKPENILIQEGEAMLTDFGIALAVTEAGGNRLTEPGLSLGTPQYMSPEQATGDRQLDARSDVYSLGAVLYEMLAGEPPVTGPNVKAMIAKLMTERPTRLRVVRDTVPDGIDTAVAKALSKIPADRFASVSEFSRVISLSRDVPARPRWIRVAVAGGVVVVLGAVAWVALGHRSPVAEAFTPQFVQLTTDGNARSPSLSPDGTRLAYVARDCAEDRCTERLVVGDTGGAGTITLMTGKSLLVYGWAAQGRFLIAGPDFPTLGDAVAVSALGNAPRSLHGRVAFAVGTTDTVVASPGFVSLADTITWLRLVTVSDGLVRDSIAIRRPALGHVGFPAPHGGRIALVSATLTGWVVHLMDRTGRMTDSLTMTGVPSGFSWAPGADGVVWSSDFATAGEGFAARGAPVTTVILRQWVSSDGEFVGPTDTLLRLQPGSQLEELNLAGSALLTQGPMETVVSALERGAPGRLDFRSRRLAASTAGLQAVLSRDGSMVWLKRAGSGTGALRRDAFVPFDGGAERPFDLPAGSEIGSDWTRPVSSALLYAVRDASGRARLTEIAVGTGQERDVSDLPQRTGGIFPIPRGGYAAVDVEAHSARVIGRPGRSDTTWSVPVVAGRMFVAPMDMSPDGRAFFEFSQITQGDTVWVRRVPLDGGVASPAVAVPVNVFLCVLADGSIESVVKDPSGVLGWYRIPPGGSRAVRLGDAPVQDARATWTNSDDGRRFIVVQPVDRPDVYLIRNFGELLRH